MTIAIPPLRWFAFTTTPSRETAAREMLGEYAAETRLPRGVRELKRSPRGKVRKRSYPLMAGYAFAGFDAPQRLARLLEALETAHMRGQRLAVRRLVATAAGNPLELKIDGDGRPWWETMDYSTVQLEGGEARPLGWGRGDIVRMTEGPFEGFRGPVERVNGERARLLLDMFGRSVPLEIDVTEAVLVKRAPAPPAPRYRPQIGDTVKIVAGPFANFEGPVEDIGDGGKLTVATSIFGRANPVQVTLAEIAFVKRTR